ncbi:TPA: acyltransferase [Kluyvera cryocrescens]|nr:acyltransferase [Kluyvera cryocrescens]
MDKLDSLQYGRAIAALLVVIAHSSNQFYMYQSTGHELLDGIIGQMVNAGNIGVYIFFVISGYIMSYTTKNKEFNHKYALTFIKRRFKRIFPIYWVYLSILVTMWYFGLALRSEHFSLQKVMLAYFLIPDGNDSGQIITPVMSQSWTLSYEIFFYLCFFALIVIGTSKKHLVTCLSVVFFMLFIFAHQGILPSDVSNAFYSKWLIFLFIFGIAIEQSSKKLKEWLSFLSDSAMIWLSALTILIAVFSPKNEVLACILSTLALCFILQVKKPFPRLELIGDASYTIYLTHNFIIMGYGMFAKRVDAPLISALMAVAAAIATIPFGLLCYNLIEKRIHR